jgi:hypothetical protein
MLYRSILITLCLTVSLFSAETVSDSLSSDTITVSTERDSMVPDSLVEQTDSMDTTAAVSEPDSLLPAAAGGEDSGTTDEKQTQVPEIKDIAATPVVRKIKLRKREYNYRQQIGLAVGMMAFIAIMMTTAQTLNPK